MSHLTGKSNNILNGIITEKNLLKKKYRQKLKELSTIKEGFRHIFKINHTINSSIDLKKISYLICRFICKLVHTDACMLLINDEHKKMFTINSGYGFTNGFIKELSFDPDDEIKSALMDLNKPWAVSDITKEPRIKCDELVRKEHFVSQVSVPVAYGKRHLGVITTFSHKERHFTKEEVKILNVFASQIALAIQTAKSYENIRLNYFNTIHALVLAIEARDPFTHGHTERVTKYAIEIARALKLGQEEIEILRYASEVHDVGKISIPDFILNKPGRLTPSERAIIELHPVKGEEMLEPLEFLKAARLIVRHHHERYDGTGYPDGLEKERIPLMSRIIACADAFDAMTSERPYRKRKLSVEEALVEIKNNSGSQFDPQIAHLFIKTLKSSSSPLKNLN